MVLVGKGAVVLYDVVLQFRGRGGVQLARVARPRRIEKECIVATDRARHTQY